ncbi:MAG TPA: CBS domain-containing protein [Gammaproteobacteria bacterium]|nr:CBS domain-containing protein [Gammaproteobacteria bacterium]
MITVQHLLQEKGSSVWSIGPEATVYEAVATMADKGIGALLVMEWNRLMGIISERDYTRKIVLKERSSKDTRVKDIMTTNVMHVTPDESVDNCMLLMARHRFRHLPVVDGDRVVGMLSIRDIMNSVIAEKQLLIEQLENYIAGAA